VINIYQYFYQKMSEYVEFARIHASLKINSAALAADAVLNLLNAK